MFYRVRIPVSVGKRVYFKSPLDEFWLQLDSFSINQDRICWSGALSTGQILEGRIKDQISIPSIKGAWACLAIPVVVHVFSQNSVDFIFCVPTSFTVEARDSKETGN